MASVIEAVVHSKGVEVLGPGPDPSGFVPLKYRPDQPISPIALKIRTEVGPEMRFQPTGSHNGIQVACDVDLPSAVFHPGRSTDFDELSKPSWYAVFGTNPLRPSEQDFGELITVRFLGHADRNVLAEAIASQSTEMVEPIRSLGKTSHGPKRDLLAIGGLIEGVFTNLDDRFKGMFHGSAAFFAELDTEPYNEGLTKVRLGAATIGSDGLIRVRLGKEITVAGESQKGYSSVTGQLDYYLSRLAEISAFMKTLPDRQGWIMDRGITSLLLVDKLSNLLADCWRGSILSKETTSNFRLTGAQSNSWDEVLKVLPDGLVSSERQRITYHVTQIRERQMEIEAARLAAGLAPASA